MAASASTLMLRSRWAVMYSRTRRRARGGNPPRACWCNGMASAGLSVNDARMSGYIDGVVETWLREESILASFGGTNRPLESSTNCLRPTRSVCGGRGGGPNKCLSKLANGANRRPSPVYDESMMRIAPGAQRVRRKSRRNPWRLRPKDKLRRAAPSGGIKFCESEQFAPFPARSRFSSCKLVEQPLRGLQIRRRKPFRKARVNRRQRGARLRAAALLPLQPGQARGRAQFPGESGLRARVFDRPLEEIFGAGDRTRRMSAEHQLALDAQQLRDAPALVIVLGTCDRAIDRLECLGEFSGVRHRVGQLAEQRQIAWKRADLGDFGQHGSQRMQSGRSVAALDQHDAFEAAGPGVPKAQTVLRRTIEQHLDETIGRG